jgi:serine/threonine-protein kinase
MLGIGAMMVILAGFAYLESALRPLRKGRRRVLSFVGCAFSAAVIALGAVAFATSLGHANPTVGGMVAAATLTAFAGVAFGAGLRRSGLRKGARRAVRRAETAYATAP